MGWNSIKFDLTPTQGSLVILKELLMIRTVYLMMLFLLLMFLFLDVFSFNCRFDYV